MAGFGAGFGESYGGGGGSYYEVVPDYANMESINRITTNGGAWIVEQTGFVQAAGSANGSTGHFWVHINGQSIVEWGANSYTRSYIVLPVKKDDVIIMEWDGTGGSPYCFFIPPLFVKKEPPIIVEEKNGSYSETEVETANTWLDGSKIYKKTLYFTNKTFSPWTYITLGSVSTLIPNLSLILKSENVQYGVSTAITGELKWLQINKSVDGLSIYGYSGWGNTVSSISFYSTIFYTKIV
jgi:hypothetical protein